MAVSLLHLEKDAIKRGIDPLISRETVNSLISIVFSPTARRARSDDRTKIG